MSSVDLQADIERFGRMYVASSQVSRAVMRSRSREELLDEVVRILVEAGRFAMAYIARHDPETHELVPVARAGNQTVYVERIRIFSDERPEGLGPGGTAFREGKPYVCNDFLKDPRTLPWREAARASGWRGSAAFPIQVGDKPGWLLTVYALESGMFGPDQVELLEQVALDIGFGLAHLAAEEQRRHAEAALAASEQRLSMAMDGAGLATYDRDLRTGRIAWGGHLEDLFGFEAGSFDGTSSSFESRIHPDDLPQMRRKTALAREGRRAFSEEFRVVWPDGSEHWIVARGEGHYDSSGQPDRSIGILLDVTERKRAQAEQEQLREQLFQAQKMESIGRLAGGVAHDFNNMLTVINGYSLLLLDKLRPGDPARDDLSEINKAGLRAAGLTQQLLAFSRRQVLQPRVLDVNRVVAEIQPMLERLVGEHVEVCVRLHPAPATVNADPNQLEQVVMNLAVNSRDALRQGGRIVIETGIVERTERAPGASEHPAQGDTGASSYVLLAVSDNGTGMDDATRKRAFDPFFTTKESGKGTGLGLSIVQGIVEQSGGFVELITAPGRGTTFNVYLPRTTKAVATDEQAHESVAKTSGTETVLVVEDQAQVLRFAVTALSDCGYRVLAAQDAGEALSICERQLGRIDLVITDIVMPHLSGVELAGRLRELWPEIKVLFMSGYPGDASLDLGLAEGAAEFIQKPFNPTQLAGKVRELLDRGKRRARIVVADDEAGVRRFLKVLLEGAGYLVTEAADGGQALEAVEAGGVDLLITDLVMPEQEGLETIRDLRRKRPEVGIIAISGAFGGRFLMAARILGADAVLGKPVSAETLLAKVAEVLRAER